MVHGPQFHGSFSPKGIHKVENQETPVRETLESPRTLKGYPMMGGTYLPQKKYRVGRVFLVGDVVVVSGRY